MKVVANVTVMLHAAKAIELIRDGNIDQAVGHFLMAHFIHQQNHGEETFTLPLDELNKFLLDQNHPITEGELQLVFERIGVQKLFYTDDGENEHKSDS